MCWRALRIRSRGIENRRGDAICFVITKCKDMRWRCGAADSQGEGDAKVHISLRHGLGKVKQLRPVSEWIEGENPYVYV